MSENAIFPVLAPPVALTITDLGDRLAAGGREAALADELLSMWPLGIADGETIAAHIEGVPTATSSTGQKTERGNLARLC
jgi:hypothetical protein